MNSKQRRKAYRAMPKPGAIVSWRRRSGQIVSAVAVGPMPAGLGQWNEERGNVPNVLRLRVEHPNGGFSHPLLSRLTP